jgi:hypothetical protein
VQYYYARTHGGGTDPPLSGGAPALNALLISSPVDPRPASLSLDRSASSASACCPAAEYLERATADGSWHLIRFSAPWFIRREIRARLVSFRSGFCFCCDQCSTSICRLSSSRVFMIDFLAEKASCLDADLLLVSDLFYYSYLLSRLLLFSFPM